MTRLNLIIRTGCFCWLPFHLTFLLSHLWSLGSTPVRVIPRGKWTPIKSLVQFSSVQFRCSVLSDSLRPYAAAQQASLSITNSWSLFKLMSTESVMPPNHFILCRPLLLPPSIFLSIRVFSNEAVLCIRWPKYWSFSISPSKEYSGLIFFRIDWLELLAVQGTLKSLLQHPSQKHEFFSAQLPLWSSSHIHT